MTGFEKAFEGRSLSSLPDELVEAMARAGGGSQILALRQGKADAVAQALKVVNDDKAAKPQRLQFVQIFGEVKLPATVPALVKIAESQDEELRGAALTALLQYDEPAIGATVVKLYNNLPPDSRSIAQTLLASRTAWSLQLLQAVDAGQIDRRTIPLDVVRKLQLHRNGPVAELVAKYWGQVQGETSAEMQKQIQRLATVCRSGSGDPYNGKKLFLAHCSKCHTLFGQGGKIGPDLTAFKRDDLDNMLLNIVNPSAEIREGFENFVVVTEDGRTVNGFLADNDNRVVVLRGQDGQNIVIPRDQIDEMAAVRNSLMPEGLMNLLTEQEVRDLLAYLRSTQPLNN